MRNKTFLLQCVTKQPILKRLRWSEQGLSHVLTFTISYEIRLLNCQLRKLCEHNYLKRVLEERVQLSRQFRVIWMPVICNANVKMIPSVHVS